MKVSSPAYVGQTHGSVQKFVVSYKPSPVTNLPRYGAKCGQSSASDFCSPCSILQRIVGGPAHPRPHCSRGSPVRGGREHSVQSSHPRHGQCNRPSRWTKSRIHRACMVVRGTVVNSAQDRSECSSNSVVLQQCVPCSKAMDRALVPLQLYETIQPHFYNRHMANDIDRTQFAESSDSSASQQLQLSLSL